MGWQAGGATCSLILRSRFEKSGVFSFLQFVYQTDRELGAVVRAGIGSPKIARLMLVQLT